MAEDLADFCSLLKPRWRDRLPIILLAIVSHFQVAHLFDSLSPR